MALLETAFQAETGEQLLCKRKNIGWIARAEARDSLTGPCAKLKGLAPDHTARL